MTRLQLAGRIAPWLLWLLAGCIPPPSVQNGEPDDTFAQAKGVQYDDNDGTVLSGTVEPDTDVDVFDLGPMEPGDRIVVDVNGAAPTLDAAVACFDAQGRLFRENDDEDLVAGLLDPFFDEPVRHASDRYYLAISSSPFGRSSGSYTIDVAIIRGGPVPPPEIQNFLLDFDGGTVTIPGDRTYVVGPFDAAEIDPAYAGQTDEIKRIIRETFESRFAGHDMVLYTTDDDLPVPVPFSRILVGGRNPRIFGISQAVDPYNGAADDESIVFAGTFSPSVFGRLLTVEELGFAIGQVAAHEAGHLLGLNHVADVTALMDTVGGPHTLLEEQQFKNAELDDSVFSIGTQDALLLLLEILGLSGN